MILEKYTIGVGDRFAHQAAAQLQACVKLAEQGINVIPVWNKSNREHSFIGSEPQSVYDACLLYTSPSPRDGLLSRMPSSA